MINFEEIIADLYRERRKKPEESTGPRVDVIACARHGIPFAFITQDLVMIPREYHNLARRCGAMVEV